MVVTQQEVPGDLPGARRLSVWNVGDIQPTWWTLKLGNDEMVGCSYPEVLENVEAFLNGEI